MLTWAHLLAFAGVVLLAAMTPGPDFVIVTRNSAAAGRRAGLGTALGIAVGVFGWAIAAALGIAALLAASAVAFTVVKVVGAAYLLYLAFKALRSAVRSGDQPVAGTSNGREITLPAAFRQGLLTNLLNPKAGLFFVALMPQFLAADPGAGPALMLSTLAVVVVGVWFSVLATLVGALRPFFASERVRRTLDAMTGALLFALGLRLATQTQA